MDLIVCGDALWISCGTWIAIWNGAIGAFVAAVLGGLVALAVVLLSNRHQSRLAGLARRDARAEAERSREITAIADIVSLYLWVGWSYDMVEGYDHGDGYQKLEAARVRLEMASPSSEPLAEALRGWGAMLTALALAERKAQRLGSPLEDQIRSTIRRSTALIRAYLPSWPGANAEGREATLTRLSEMKTALEALASDGAEAGLMSPMRVAAEPGR